MNNLVSRYIVLVPDKKFTSVHPNYTTCNVINKWINPPIYCLAGSLVPGLRTVKSLSLASNLTHMQPTCWQPGEVLQHVCRDRILIPDHVQGITLRDRQTGRGQGIKRVSISSGTAPVWFWFAAVMTVEGENEHVSSWCDAWAQSSTTHMTACMKTTDHR